MGPDNTSHLSAAARRRRESASARAAQALERLAKAPGPHTVARLAEVAGVSRSWIYTRPEVRQRLEKLAERRGLAPHRAGPVGSQRATVASQRHRLEETRGRVQQLTAENRRLREEMAAVYGRLREENPGGGRPLGVTTSWRDEATLAAAQEAAARGQIEAWVHDYLNGAGRNVPMVRGLRRQRRWWIGPVEAPVIGLTRIVGPEPDMPFPRSFEDWEPRLAGIQKSIAGGWDVPPVIVDACRTGVLHISDGNHRFEAQRQMGRGVVWAILFFDDKKAWQSFERPWASAVARQDGVNP